MDEINRIWQKAKAYAARRGFGDEAEDFAQYFAIKWIETGGLASIDYAFLNYSEHCRAAKRVLSSPGRYLSAHVRVSLDQPVGNEDEGGASVGDFIGVPGDDMELRGEFESIVELADAIVALVKCPRVRADVSNIYQKWIMEQM